ncbi:MAG: diguanylate cyclase, partial [Burkholderiales bacterium]
LAVSLVLIADLALNFLPDEARWTRDAQLRSAEMLAVQVAVIAGDTDALGSTLRAVAARDRSVLSLALRNDNGELVAEAGDHQKHWRPLKAGEAGHGRYSIPLYRQASLWGEMEIVYRSALDPVWKIHASSPSLKVAAVLVSLGLLAYFLYLRRVLQHLDPGSVVPERVRMAFDVLTEGVMVLDSKGQVVMVNRAFSHIAPSDESIVGRKPSELAWLASRLSKDAADHPWSRAVREREAVTGVELEIPQANASPRRVVVNCAPILDTTGSARGCLVTLDDVTALNQANAHLMKTVSMLSASRKEIERQNEKLTLLALRDSLTGCFNRRAFFEVAEPLFQAASQRRGPLCCVMADIDYFKRFNDQYGHSVGDQVLVAVAKTLGAGLRQGDLLCRYGGEEFCILLPGASTQEAMEIAQRLREAVEAEAGTTVRSTQGMHITSSFGVSTLREGASSLAALISPADEALYFSKRTGRNRVTPWTSNKKLGMPGNTLTKVK